MQIFKMPLLGVDADKVPWRELTINNSSIQADLELWSLNIFADPSDKPKFVINHKGAEKQLIAKETSSMAPHSEACGCWGLPWHHYEGCCCHHSGLPQWFLETGSRGCWNLCWFECLVSNKWDHQFQCAKWVDFRSWRKTFDVSLITTEERIIELKVTAADTHLGKSYWEPIWIIHTRFGEFEKGRLPCVHVFEG